MKAYAQPEKNDDAANVFKIGIAEYKIAGAPNKIVTLGLGSCIGLVLFDPVVKIAGMVHIMLPCSKESLNVVNRFKFADTAVEDMIGLMVSAGAAQSRLKAKMAGGAHMFKTSSALNILNIGQRNAAICKKVLKENNIALCGEDIGGSSGRSIEFCCQTCMLSVRTAIPQGFLSI